LLNSLGICIFECVPGFDATQSRGQNQTEMKPARPRSTPSPSADTGQPIPVVRVIVLDVQGRALILRRQNTQYGLGAWCLPGGKVDYGDTVEQAVVGELEQETSLQCVSSSFLFYQDGLPGESGDLHCVNLYFECDACGEVRLNAESSEYAWIGPHELGEYSLVFGNDEGLRRYWNPA